MWIRHGDAVIQAVQSEVNLGSLKNSDVPDKPKTFYSRRRWVINRVCIKDIAPDGFRTSAGRNPVADQRSDRPAEQATSDEAGFDIRIDDSIP